MPEIVEGYKTEQFPTAQAEGSAAAPWVDKLRRELRQEMIRELAMRRIKSSGREYQPPVAPSRTGRMVEAFFVGVAVTLASSWLCSLAARKDGRD